MANPTGTLTGEVASKANGQAREFKNALQGVEVQVEKAAHNVGQRVGAMASDLTESTKQYVEAGRDYVKENPAKGIAIAAAAGAVAGSLLTIALRRRPSAQ